MTRALAVSVLFALACGPATTTPPDAGQPLARIDRRIALPEGAALSPDDSAHPGEAATGPLAVVKGRLYALVQNLDHYAPAGDSYLAILDSTTLATEKLVRLRLGDQPCRDANGLLPLEDSLLVSCAGNIALPPATTHDGMLVEVGLDGDVKRLLAVGRSPGGLARIGDDVWISDGEGGGLSHVSYASFEARDGMVQACDAGETKSGFVSDVIAYESRLFAACFNDDTVWELDPATGARKGSALTTGAGPLRFAAIGQRLFVLDDLGGTVSIITPGPPASSERAAVFLGRDGDEGGNDPQGIAGDESRVGITNSAYGTFVVLDLRATPHVVASVDLKAKPDAPSNFPTFVAYDGTAFFVAIPGLEFDTRTAPSEIVRITVNL